MIMRVPTGQNRKAPWCPTFNLDTDCRKSEFRKKIQALRLLANRRVATNLNDQNKEKSPHNHSDGHMGEGRMKWVGIAEFCKGLINKLNHLSIPLAAGKKLIPSVSLSQVLI